MTLRFTDGTIDRSFRDGDFPLAVRLSGDGTPVLGPEAEAAPLAWLLSHNGRLSIQPEKSRTPLALNDAALSEPAWLGDGDRITLGPVEIDIAAEGAGLVLTVRPHAPVPPAAEAAAAADEDDAQARGFGRPFAAARPARTGRTGRAGRAGGLTLRNAVLSVFLVLALGVGFVLVASPVDLRVTPQPESLTVSGFPPPIPISGRYLALPGTYLIEARKPGYRVLRQTFSVAFGAAPSLDLPLQKLPGLLDVTTTPVDGAKIMVDGAERGVSPAKDLEIDAGAREITVTSERYLPETRTLDIKGLGERQALAVALQPGWGTLSVTSAPADALVRLDGAEAGRTPLSLEPLQGTHVLEFEKDGWKPARREIAIRAGTASALPTVALEKIDGTLGLATEPPGATITVDGAFLGRTPADLPLVGDREYRLRLSREGYGDVARTVRVEGGRRTPLSIRLAPQFGTVFLTTSPPGATLAVNGRPAGSATQRLSLQTVPQSIEVRKEGYLPFRTTVTPQAGIARKLAVTLKTPGDDLRARDRQGVTTPVGDRLRLIYLPSPAKFNVGASRREPGRRSNEAEYAVELSRSFWIGEKEVTNASFRKFAPGHSSGSFQGNSLDGADQPAANLTWEDAARYANWLSKQEGLAPAYRDEGGKITPVLPLTAGYRLPTEAEWEFVARYDGGRIAAARPLRYPWGDALPPPANSGNYADDGPQRLPLAIPGYVDGFPVAAPVGRFGPSGAGLYDLGGNVAEWCHDYYDVPVAAPGAGPGTVRRNPAGPPTGRFHVIKGASWRSGGVSELRLSYREYAEKARNDVGFRIVRYVEDAPK